MSFLNKLRGRNDKKSTTAPKDGQTGPARQKRSAGSQEVLRLKLVPREWDKPDKEGADDVWGRGFMLHDERDLGYRWDDDTLAKRGVTICKVVGTNHTGDAIAHDNFGPGQRVLLVREPDNPYDPNAIGVWDAEQTLRLGYIPREVCQKLCKSLDKGHTLNALCLWEWITKPDEVRRGLRLLVTPEDVEVKL